MSGKNINFNGKKIKKSTFYKNKAINNIEEIDVSNNQFLKKNHMVIKTHFNTLLDIMIMMLLDCFAQSFHK